MKKAILSALVLAGLGLGFVSCNNGPYDANPKVNQGTILNPTNPGSGVTIPIGFMTMEINGYLATFMAGKWSDTTAGVASLIAFGYDNDHQWQVLQIALTAYNGVGAYNLLPDGSNGIMSHQLIDPSDNFYISIGHASNIGAGHATVNVEGNEDGNLRGTFSGVLFRNLPNVSTSDSDVITNGKFYLPK